MRAHSLLSAARLGKLIACLVLVASLFPKTARQCVGGSAAREISVSIIPDRHQGISGTGGARLPKRMASWCVDMGVGVRGYRDTPVIAKLTAHTVSKRLYKDG